MGGANVVIVLVTAVSREVREGERVEVEGDGVDRLVELRKHTKVVAGRMLKVRDGEVRLISLVRIKTDHHAHAMVRR